MQRQVAVHARSAVGRRLPIGILDVALAVAVAGSSLPAVPTSAASSGARDVAAASGGPSVSPTPSIAAPDPSPTEAGATDARGSGTTPHPASDREPVSTPAGTPAPGDASPQPSDPMSSASPVPTCAPGPVDLSPAAVTRHGSRSSKLVALTFDDGWGPQTTARILGILVRERVNATFFPVGLAIEREAETWKAVAAAGYPIGDHTFDHRDLAGMCYASQLAELTRDHLAVETTLGIDPQPLMRPPYAAYDAESRLAATAAGELRVVLWDVDSQDWTGISPRQIAARALAGTDGSIVVMHTFVANTAAALPQIISGYRARGFRFVTVGQLLGIPGPVPFE